MSAFISYCSKDEKYARALYNAFLLNGIEAWFAPKNIGGGEDFTEKIGQELTKHRTSAEDERVEEDYEKLISNDTDLFLLMLSKNSMQSV